MHTCLDQYRANKARGGNGYLKWIEKGGGYFDPADTWARRSRLVGAVAVGCRSVPKI
jgi:hypothetical protein